MSIPGDQDIKWFESGCSAQGLSPAPSLELPFSLSVLHGGQVYSA